MRIFNFILCHILTYTKEQVAALFSQIFTTALVNVPFLSPTFFYIL